MNKIIIGLLVFGLVLPLINCGDANTNEKIVNSEFTFKIASLKQVTFLKEMIKNGTIIGQVYCVKTPDYQQVFLLLQKRLINLMGTLILGFGQWVEKKIIQI